MQSHGDESVNNCNLEQDRGVYFSNQPLKFINTIGKPPRRDPAVRRAVRIHVMQRYQHHKRQGELPEKTINSASPDDIFNSAFEAAQYSLAPDPGERKLDPFDSLALTASGDLHMLLAHSNSDVTRTSVHVNPRGLFLSCAVADAPLLHLTLSDFIARLGVHLGDDKPEKSVFHKQTTIRLLNERLGDPVNALSDATIATVSCLTNMEVRLSGFKNRLVLS